MSVSPLRVFAGSGVVDNEVVKAVVAALCPPFVGCELSVSQSTAGMMSRTCGEGVAAIPPLDGNFLWRSSESFPHSFTTEVVSRF